MKYRINVNVPASSNDDSVINTFINAMSQAGAGRIGNYSRVAYMSQGYEAYKGEEGSWEKASKEIEKNQSVRIEMQCEHDKIKDVITAIRKIHPYEEPVIELVRLEELPV